MKDAPLHHSLLLTMLVVTAAPASAQDQVDPRWGPWLGCWTVSVDTTRGGDAVFADQQAPQARVCVSAQGNAASLATEVADKPALTQAIVADGSQRPLSEGGCTGSQKVEWSSDGSRLYSRAELTCAGGARRTVSGISLLTPDGTWIDAQSVDLAGRSSVRVRRFRREQPAPAAARFVPERLTIENVIEASPHVAAPALEAALVESRASFGLNARRLLQMDAAGVASSVIDVMVALTYPQAFSVRPTSRADRLTPFPFGMDPSDPDYPWWYGDLHGPGAYFDSAYLFSPFGYAYLPYYPPYFGGGGIIVDGGGAAADPGRLLADASSMASAIHAPFPETPKPQATARVSARRAGPAAAGAPSAARASREAAAIRPRAAAHRAEVAGAIPAAVAAEELPSSASTDVRSRACSGSLPRLL